MGEKIIRLAMMAVELAVILGIAGFFGAWGGLAFGFVGSGRGWGLIICSAIGALILMGVVLQEFAPCIRDELREIFPRKEKQHA